VRRRLGNPKALSRMGISRMLAKPKGNVGATVSDAFWRNATYGAEMSDFAERLIAPVSSAELERRRWLPCARRWRGAGSMCW
jgi:hypothetical protein